MSNKKKVPKRAHDRSRRLIFQHPRAVRDLVGGFVDEPWVDDLDFGTLMRVPSDSLSAMLPGEFEDRSNDVLWKVRWKGAWLYVYILLEFQSSVDPFMAVRISFPPGDSRIWMK